MSKETMADKIVKGIIRYIILLILIIAGLIFVVKTGNAEIPSHYPGENFQRPKFIDCQTYWIESFPGNHKEQKITSCFYEGYYMENGEPKLVIIELRKGKNSAIFHVNNR